MKVGASIICVSLILLSYQPPIEPFRNTDGPTFPVEVSTDKYFYDLGEIVDIALTNVGDENVSFPVPPDLYIVDNALRIVVDTKYCGKYLYEVRLLPGANYSTKWRQVYLICREDGFRIPPSGEQVPPGQYSLCVGADVASYGDKIMPLWDCVGIGIGPGNEPPVADAGLDQTVTEGDTATFDGTGSYDPDGSIGDGNWTMRASTIYARMGAGSATLNGEVYYISGCISYPPPHACSPWSVVSKYNVTTNAWSSLRKLPESRVNLGAATANGKIYAIGGNNGSDSTDTNYELDPATGIWTSKAPLPLPLESFGIASVNDKIYVMGGYSTLIDCYPCGSVYEYDPVTDSWTQKPDLPTSRAGLAAAVLDDEIYVIGGDAPEILGAVEVYDPITEKWTARADMMSPRTGLTAEVLGGYIFTLGGRDDWGYRNLNEMYNPYADNWTSKSPMMEPKLGHVSGVVGSCMYSIGGHSGHMIGILYLNEEYCLIDPLMYEWDFGDGSPPGAGARPTHVYGDSGSYNVTLEVTDVLGASDTDSCDIIVLEGNQPPVADAGPDQTVHEGDVVQFDGSGSYDDDNGEYGWEVLSNLSFPRMELAAAAIDSEIFAIGGFLGDAGSPSQNDWHVGTVEVYDVTQNLWFEGTPMEYNRSRLSAESVSNRIYAMGGTQHIVLMPPGVLGHNEEYDLGKDQWTLKAGMPIPRASFATAVVDGKIYVMGGYYFYEMGLFALLNRTEAYDPSTDSWTLLSPMPTPRSDLALAVLDGKIYAIGGYGGSRVVEIYDVDTDTWTTGTEMPANASMFGITAEVLGGRIYVMGGFGGDCVQSVVLSYDPKTDDWRQEPKMNYARNYHASVTVGNAIYVMGGTRGWMCGNPAPAERFGPAFEPVYEWDFDASVDSDGDGNYTNDVDGTGPTPTHVYLDDGSYTVTLKVTDGEGLWDTDTCVITVVNSPPVAQAAEGEDKEGYEVSTFTFDGSCTDPGALDTHTYEWDFDYDGVNFDVDAIGQSVTNTWSDDFDGDVALRVTDDDGGVGMDTVHVLVKNVPPTVELKVLPIEADVFLRIAGEKWHDVSIELYEDDGLIAEGSLTRYPGSPNDQMLDLTHLSVNISRRYSAIVRYTPEDDPVNGQPNGANPCWIVLRFDDGEELWLHHTFNVQHPETYTWEVDLMAAILSHGLTFEATAYDPGADDLTFHWDFDDGTTSTTSFPNPGSICPVNIVVTIIHVFPGSGTFTITLTVEDDDGGTATVSLVMSF